MSDLRKLIKAVEAGTATGIDSIFVPKEMSRLIEATFGDDEKWSMFVGAHDGSVDDALDLVAAMLPGWGWAVEADSAACVWHPDTLGVSRDIHLSANPGRALLLAILHALDNP